VLQAHIGIGVRRTRQSIQQAQVWIYSLQPKGSSGRVVRSAPTALTIRGPWLQRRQSLPHRSPCRKRAELRTRRSTIQAQIFSALIPR